MYKKIFLSVLAALVIVSCQKQEKKENTPEDVAQNKIKIVATTNQVADLVNHIGGKRVDVEGLLGTGVDPHLYRAGEGDVVKMHQADMIFYNGLHLEGSMEDLFENMKERTEVNAISDGIPEDSLLKSDDYENAYDPHIWLDVSLWKLAAEYTKEKFIEHDPKNKEVYEKNYKNYSHRLDTLDNYIRKRISELPENRRYLITAHDAFNYFGKAYDFKVIGLQGISTETKAGTKDVQRLSDLIVEKDIPAIFIEASVPAKSIKALKEAVEAKGYKTKHGGELYTDSLGNPGTFQGTYIGMMTYNINQIVKALSK